VWPQVVPAGLPAFPGPGWVPDQPPPAEVQARASALLPQLWQSGAGTFKTEQTAGRWITYQAQQMGSKRGVVAWREAAANVAPSPIAPVTVSPVTNAVVPAVAPSGHPTVQQGARGDIVKQIQSIVGTTPDGVWGAGTTAAVKAWQGKHGLAADGIFGPKSWAAAGLSA